MKTELLIFSLIILLFVGCQKDEPQYPKTVIPEIRTETNELYSNPNRKFIIRAELKDEIGLRDVRIKIPELYLDKIISFPTDSLIKNYLLSYEFLAPSETKTSDKYKVFLTLANVSGNSINKELILNLDGDFQAPKISNVKPSDGSVILASQEDSIKLNIYFNVTDTAGIDSVIVFLDELNINEKIKVGGLKNYVFDKIYLIPSKVNSYELSIITVDNFIYPNRETTRIRFSVSEGLTVLYLADVPKGSDLTEDIFGIPMYYHKKEGEIYTFKYYADRANKEIYFLGQENSFEPHCFGTGGYGKLENSSSAQPIVLPEKGYYIITVDLSKLIYNATLYIPQTSPYTPGNITICGNGILNGGWDPNNTDLLLSANPENPYQLERALTLTGGDVAMTITSPNWSSPWWRLDKNGIIVFLGGNNASYKGAVGTYKFIMDTELERAILGKVKE